MRNSQYSKSSRWAFHILLHLAMMFSLGSCKQNDTNGLTISTHDITVLIEEAQSFSIGLAGPVNQNANITFQIQHPELLNVVPEYILVEKDKPEHNFTIWVRGISPGNVEVWASVNPKDAIDVSTIYVRVLVAISSVLIYISSIIGWAYFVAWSVSFYPQIITNFRRKSVVGLNFDFISLNVVGFLLYATFNIGLYYNEYIQGEYYRRNPRGLNPVQLNDVFFSVHAFFATIFTIVQCSIYERGEQRVSIMARSILTIFFLCVVTLIILASTAVVHWLDFLYACSYIKLCITLIKYMPQAYMNYRRKSTNGWSIGNVLLDFTGGWLSILQMMINAYNYDDWASIFGDPTKFGLGLFSVMFDVLFMVQHYILYRNLQPYAEMPGDTVDVDRSDYNVNDDSNSGPIES